MGNLASVFAVTVSMAHKHHKSDAQGVKLNSSFTRLVQSYPRINKLQTNHKQPRQGPTLLDIVTESMFGVFEVLARVVDSFRVFAFLCFSDAKIFDILKSEKQLQYIINNPLDFRGS